MYFVGLTGGIASGKSTVSTLLKNFGIAVIDADQMAREVVLPDRPLLGEIAKYFGDKVLHPDRTLNRTALGQIIFADSTKRIWLNQLLHPAIEAAILQQADLLARQGELVIVFDIPLLFETGWQQRMRETWLVYLPEDKQLERLMQRDKLSVAEARQRIQSQMPLVEKMQLADRVIDNSANIEKTGVQIKAELERLKKLIASKVGLAEFKVEW